MRFHPLTMVNNVKLHREKQRVHIGMSEGDLSLFCKKDVPRYSGFDVIRGTPRAAPS